MTMDKKGTGYKSVRQAVRSQESSSHKGAEKLFLATLDVELFKIRPTCTSKARFFREKYERMINPLPETKIRVFIISSGKFPKTLDKTYLIQVH